MKPKAPFPKPSQSHFWTIWFSDGTNYFYNGDDRFYIKNRKRVIAYFKKKGSF